MGEIDTRKLQNLQRSISIEYYPREVVDEVLADIALRLSPRLDSTGMQRSSVSHDNALDIIEARLLDSKEEDAESSGAVTLETGDVTTIGSALDLIKKIPEVEGLCKDLQELHKKLIEQIDSEESVD